MRFWRILSPIYMRSLTTFGCEMKKALVLTRTRTTLVALGDPFSGPKITRRNERSVIFIELLGRGWQATGSYYCEILNMLERISSATPSPGWFHGRRHMLFVWTNPYKGTLRRRNNPVPCNVNIYSSWQVERATNTRQDDRPTSNCKCVQLRKF